MGKIKKILCMLLVCAMVIVPCSVLGSVSAQTDDTEPLKVEVTTDKSSYTAYGIAEITVNVTNISDETINNISAEAVFEQLAPIGKNNETFKEIETLEPGESFSFSYKATVNANKVKLNFFEKIILWFVRLFNGGYSATDNNFNNNRDFVSKTDIINFGKYSVNNEIKVWYELGGFTEQELDDMSTVDETLKDLKSTDNFKSLDEDNRKEQIKIQLEELEKEGLINSIFYDSKTKSFIFMYSSGISGGVSLESYQDKPANDLSFASSNYNRSNSCLTDITTTPKEEKIDGKQIFISYGWDNYTDYNSKFSLYQMYVDEFKSKGLSTDLSPNITVEKYKTVLLDKDLVCIMEHGKTVAVRDLFSTTYIYSFVTRENITKQTDSNYYEDLNKGRIYKRDNSYCITPEFFSYYYSDNKLDDTIVFIGSCSGFGSGQVIDYNFSHEFCEKCGANAVVGFHNDTRMGYSSMMMYILVSNLVKGMTVSESIKNAQEQLGYNDCEWIRNNYSDTEMSNIIDDNGKTVKENVEYCEYYNLEGTPIVAGIGDTKWESNYNIAVSGLVKDKETNAVISGVSVEVIDNESDSFDPIATTTTDKNGKFTLNLSSGSYSLSFNHDDYEYYGMSLTVGSDENIVLDDILLTPKDSSSGDSSDENNNNDETSDNNQDSEENGDNEENKDNENDSKIIDWGSCGDDIEYTIYEDGELVISGTGEMKDYYGMNPWYNHRNIIKSVRIEEGTTRIGNYAFYNCKNIVEVFFPDSIQRIGSYAFYNCESLKEISIPQNISYIENYAFSGWIFLEKLTLPNGVYSIGVGAFSCFIKNLYFEGEIRDWCKISFGTTSASNPCGSNPMAAAENEFFNGKTVTELIVPEDVYYVSSAQFLGFGSLKSVVIHKNVKEIKAYAFAGCSSLESVSIETGVKVTGIAVGCKKIGISAFENCTSLKSITLPETISIVDKVAFSGCENLASITVLNSSCGLASTYCMPTLPKETVIYGYKNSSAQEYAEQHGNVFVAID